MDDDGKEEEKYDEEPQQPQTTMQPLFSNSDVPAHRQQSLREEQKYQNTNVYDDMKEASRQYLEDMRKAEENEKDKKWIEFKWDKLNVKHRDNCDTKHMLYLLWRACKKTKDRQEMRNQTFKNYGRDDRVLKIPDFTQLMTDFIDWHVEDFENHKFDGAFVKNSDRIPCIDKIKEIGQVKEGWGIKIYKYLTKDVRIPTEAKVKFPNYKHDAIGLSLESLSVDQMIELLQKPDVGVFAKCRAVATSKDTVNEWKLEGYTDDLIKFVTERKLDGAAFLATKRNLFVGDVKKFLIGDGDAARKKLITKLTGAITKIHGGIEKANLNEILK